MTSVRELEKRMSEAREWEHRPKPKSTKGGHGDGDDRDAHNDRDTHDDSALTNDVRVDAEKGHDSEDHKAGVQAHGRT